MDGAVRDATSEAAGRGRMVPRAAALCLVLLAGGVAAGTLAVAAYPGGSWADQDGAGFAMLRNYWCDLTREAAVNGADNMDTRGWSRLAFAGVGAALVPFWFVAAADLRRRARRTVTAGVIAALCLLAIGLLGYAPDEPWHAWWHGVLSATGGTLGLVATAGVVAGGARTGPVHVLGVAFLLGAVAHAAVYADVLLRARETSAVLPVVQKVATLLLLAWVAAVAVRGLRRRADDTEGPVAPASP